MSELELLRSDPNFYTSLYRQHRVLVFQHLKQFTPDEAYIADLYQDAIIVFVERVRDPYFHLSCSVRTYLIAICRNQLFKRAGRQAEMVKLDGEKTNYHDWLQNEQEMERKKTQLDRLDDMLVILKERSKQCYELLYRFFFLKESFALIAQVMDYTNADNAKNQKARCQKKLRELYMNQDEH